MFRLCDCSDNDELVDSVGPGRAGWSSFPDLGQPHPPPGQLCTILYFFLSGMGNIDDQHRNPNTNNKDHLVGQLTTHACTQDKRHSLQTRKTHVPCLQFCNGLSSSLTLIVSVPFFSHLQINMFCLLLKACRSLWVEVGCNANLIETGRSPTRVVK